MYEVGFLHKGWWNLLPGEVVEADTIVSFKGHLDIYMNRMGIEGYGPLERVGGFSSPGQHGRCRLGGPKGLFLCCNFLCSLFFVLLMTIKSLSIVRKSHLVH